MKFETQYWKDGTESMNWTTGIAKRPRSIIRMFGRYKTTTLLRGDSRKVAKVTRQNGIYRMLYKPTFVKSHLIISKCKQNG
jgi:hypothetical protein